jgi:ribokinase
MKVTTIGTATIDIFFSSDAFILEKNNKKVFLCQNYGGKIEIDDHEITTGGAGTNVAVALARRGHEVSIIAELGRDNFAEIITNELSSEGVNPEYLIIEKLEKTACSAILRGADGGRTIMVSRSASGMLDDYDIPLDYLATREWLHLSSIGGSLNPLSEIWQVFDLAPLGFSWNPGKKELTALANNTLFLPKVTQGVFLVNDQEWQIVTALHQDILKAFTYVIITAGSKVGKIFVSGKLFQQFHPPSLTDIVDETGAGDAFCSGFISTIMYGRPVEEALTAATNNAANVIKFIGAKKGLTSF